jgi:hypothetical protein
MQFRITSAKSTSVTKPAAGLTPGLKVQTRVKAGPGGCMFCPKKT